MNQPEITVIVPVYNTEKYLSTCIESILNQTFTNFELLLIDDGSTDNSGQICDEYSNKHEKIKVTHQKNSGVSFARNTGIEIASGDYICFIDSDDWIEKDYLLKLYENANLYDLIILTDISYDYPKYSNQRSPNYSNEIYLRDNFFHFFLENDFFTIGDGGCYSKLYKKHIIDKDHQRFILKNAAYEDTLFTYEYISKCNSIRIEKGPHYHYVQSATESLSKIKHSYQNYLDSGLKGLELTEMFAKNLSVSFGDFFYERGIAKFLNMFNYSIFSLYSSKNVVDINVRNKILNDIKAINYQYKKYYKPGNYKFNLVKKILLLKNNKLIDSLFIILFTIRKLKKRKS